MGDTDNNSQLSKKRSAGVQDNEDTSEHEQESGTFKRARNDDDSKGAVTVTSDSVIKSPAKLENNATEESTAQNGETADGTFKSSVEVINNESGGYNSEPKDAKGEEYDEKKQNTETTTPFSLFKHLSSGQNAFSGIIGTGFSSTSFSFGSLSDNKSSLSFGSSVGKTVSKSEETKFPPMQEVFVVTGEENEKVVFTADSALYEFTDGVWKEKGKGELKVNVSTGPGPAKARLVMRARGNYRLILNAGLFPDMKLTGMEKKGVTFACVNIAGEGQKGLSTVALKFRDPSIVEEFQAVVMEHKGKNKNNDVSLKTPENSPNE